jgi:hypothetical protein
VKSSNLVIRFKSSRAFRPILRPRAAYVRRLTVSLAARTAYVFELSLFTSAAAEVLERDGSVKKGSSLRTHNLERLLSKFARLRMAAF